MEMKIVTGVVEVVIIKKKNIPIIFIGPLLKVIG